MTRSGFEMIKMLSLFSGFSVFRKQSERNTGSFYSQAAAVSFTASGFSFTKAS